MWKVNFLVGLSDAEKVSTLEFASFDECYTWMRKYGVADSFVTPTLLWWLVEPSGVVFVWGGWTA